MNIYLVIALKCVIALVFGVLFLLLQELIFYIIIRKQNRMDEFKAFKNKNKSLFIHSKFIFKNSKKVYFPARLLIVALVIILSLVSDGSKTYYDRNGNIYKSEYDVLYYDSDGNTYKLLKNDRYFTDANGDLTELECLDSDGYIIDISEIDVYVSGFVGIDYSKDPVEYYYSPKFVHWNENGEMFYKGRGNGENQTFPVAETQNHVNR